MQLKVDSALLYKTCWPDILFDFHANPIPESELKRFRELKLSLLRKIPAKRRLSLALELPFLFRSFVLLNVVIFESHLRATRQGSAI